MRDKTLKDLNRRPLSFNRSQVAEALPEYFGSEYPKLIQLLESYYQYLDSDEGAFGYRLKDLATTRDIGQTATSNLTYIEDELLLGQNYIEGVLDKRTGTELSNNFYRSKGTKFSIQRFFRAFFGVDPEIRYGKDLTFNVGETPIGPESGKFIQNDKLYQYWALEIQSPVSQSEWIELYKLFVHPGGMYVASSVILANTVGQTPALNLLGFAYINDQDIKPITYQSQGDLAISSFVETLEIVTSGGTAYRLRPELNISAWSDSEYTMQWMSDRYPNIIGAADVTTFTIDQDSDVGLLTSMETTRETVDQDTYNYYDSA
jgi:hypothetical protein